MHDGKVGCAEQTACVGCQKELLDIDSIQKQTVP